jgi:hypothetical protein
VLVEVISELVLQAADVGCEVMFGVPFGGALAVV